MARWMRFVRNGKLEFGTLDGDTIARAFGDMAGLSPQELRRQRRLVIGNDSDPGSYSPASEKQRKRAQ